ILPLVAAPTANLTSIARAMQFAVGNSTTLCAPRVTPGGQIAGGTLKARGRQQPGFRFMLGLTSVADARFYDLSTASLQSNADTAPGASAGGSDQSMRAAMRLPTQASATHTWPTRYDSMRTAAGTADGEPYPGTMPVYAAVPTTGLDNTTATDLAQLL